MLTGKLRIARAGSYRRSVSTKYLPAPQHIRKMFWEMLHFYEQLILIVTGFVVASKVSPVATPTFTCYHITNPSLYVIKLREECLISNTWPWQQLFPWMSSSGEIFITERPEIQPCFWSKIVWGFPLSQTPKAWTVSAWTLWKDNLRSYSSENHICGGCEKMCFSALNHDAVLLNLKKIEECYANNPFPTSVPWA